MSKKKSKYSYKKQGGRWNIFYNGLIYQRHLASKQDCINRIKKLQK